MSKSDAPVNVLECRGLSVSYTEAATSVEVLRGIDITIASGESVVVTGASGSGKSTLLQTLGGLMRASAGTISLGGVILADLSPRQLGNLRNQNLGFVYQFHHLLPEFSALENVAMPLLIRGEARSVALERSGDFLAQVGLSHRLPHKPGELSGGERQRAAVARALVTRPALVLADEPTGNLDTKTAREVQDLMLSLVASAKLSLFVATHDLDFASRFSRRFELARGQLSGLN